MGEDESRDESFVSADLAEEKIRKGAKKACMDGNDSDEEDFPDAERDKKKKNAVEVDEDDPKKKKNAVKDKKKKKKKKNPEPALAINAEGFDHHDDKQKGKGKKGHRKGKKGHHKGKKGDRKGELRIDVAPDPDAKPKKVRKHFKGCSTCCLLTTGFMVFFAIVLLALYFNYNENAKILPGTNDLAKAFAGKKRVKVYD